MKIEIYPTSVRIKLPQAYVMSCPRCNKKYTAVREGGNGLTYHVEFNVDRCKCKLPLRLDSF